MPRHPTPGSSRSSWASLILVDVGPAALADRPPVNSIARSPGPSDSPPEVPKSGREGLGLIAGRLVGRMVARIRPGSRGPWRSSAALSLASRRWLAGPRDSGPIRVVGRDQRSRPGTRSTCSGSATAS